MPASMMGIGLDEEEEKEEEDNQSIVSYFSGLGYDQDHIPTRDTGIIINSFIFLRSWIRSRSYTYKGYRYYNQ